MKICPRCEKTYPDTEAFCQTDGSALVAKGPAFAEQGSTSGSAGAGVECPVCGGKAEPGEVICNFCGTRLTTEDGEETAEPSQRSQTASRPGTQVYRGSGTGSGSGSGGGRRRRTWAVIGYLGAAALALAAGVYLALNLSPGEPSKVATAPTPSAVATPAEAAAGPTVALATNPALQVVSPTGSAAPERDLATARSKFEDGKPSLLDAYRAVLSGSPGVSDGMMVRIHVLPDGTVNHVAVTTSTSPNPDLDAKVVKSISGWKFATSSAPQVKIDYPIIFAPTAADRAKIESALQTKVAGLSPSEAPEYAYSMPTPAVAPTPKVAAAPTPAPAPTPAEARPARRVAPRRAPRERLAAIPKPTPSLLDRVQQALKSNRKLRGAHAYTAGGTVTLYGRVFDNNAKYLAERVVKRVPGVTGVANTLTTDTAKWAAEQATIAQQLQNAGLPNVTVKVIGSDAYLGGTVKTELERQRAVTIAEAAAPVRVRSNLIRVETGRVFGF